MPFDQVDPKDINDNVKAAQSLQKDLQKLTKLKADVLKSFETKLKTLEDSEKELEKRVKIALDRCKYHKTLKTEIESGKIAQKNEDDYNRRVKEFKGVVEREDEPAFEEESKHFEYFLEEFKKILK